MENSKNYWTPEKVSEFRQELTDKITEKMNYIKHCFILIAIFSLVSIYSIVLYSFSTIGIVTLIVCSLGIISSLIAIKKYKISITFIKVVKEMPYNFY